MSKLSRPVLLINAAHEAMMIISARRALRLIVKQKARIEEGLGWEIYPGIEMPSVVRLEKYRFLPVQMKMLTRENIYARDRYICQYCGKRYEPKYLSLDHVIPESRGGPFSWDNIVTACRKCNHVKADKTPEEAGMILLHTPRRLTIHTHRIILRLVGLEEDKRWAKYLYA